jgi:hypothetical protein
MSQRTRAGARTGTLLVLTVSMLSGCAALKSTRHDDDRLAPGLGYYLPNGDLKVTMTVANDGGGPTRSFKIETLYYPDVSERYTVTVPKNVLGETQATIQVSEAGLLQSVTYTYEPKLLDAVEAIPPTVSSPPQTMLASDNVGACATPGDYVIVIAPNERTGELCGLQIRVTSLGAAPGSGVAGATAREAQPDATYGPRHIAAGRRMPTNGLYFRMNLPYRIDVLAEDGKSLLHSDIALSPTGASTLFVQTHRSLFATISGSITFDDGVLVSFAPKSTSEIETAFKLPAAILKAYFDSVNALFVLRTGVANSETQYLTAVENMRKAKADLDACRAAHLSGDQAKIDAACGTGGN